MARSGESLTSERRIVARDKQAECLRLRKKGLSYQAIADEIGYSNASGAEKAVKAALDRITQEPAEELLKLEIQRLDTMLLNIWDKVCEGDLYAIDRVLKIMERRAKFLGIDVPTKIDAFIRSDQKIIFGNREVKF